MASDGVRRDPDCARRDKKANHKLRPQAGALGMQEVDYRRHSNQSNLKYAAWKRVPNEIQAQFEPPHNGSSGVALVCHDAMDEAIVLEKAENQHRIRGLDTDGDTVCRENTREEHIGSQLLILTSHDGVFWAAYRRGLSCLLIQTPVDLPPEVCVVDHFVLVEVAGNQRNWVKKLYNSEDAQGVWTLQPSALKRLPSAEHVTEIAGRPELMPAGEVAPGPGLGPVFTEENGNLCRVKYDSDEEKKYAPILNCVPRPVDRIADGGETFLRICLEQGGVSSRPFDLTAEVATSPQKLMQNLTMVGEDLDIPPTEFCNSLKKLRRAVKLYSDAQWPGSVPPAKRSDHWGHFSPDAGGDAWLFEDGRVYTCDHGLREVERGEVYVGDSRVKVDPTIDMQGPSVSLDEEASLREVEEVVEGPHGALVAQLLVSFISLCAANVLPSVRRDKNFLLFLSGVKGSGKTTTAELTLACFGQTSDDAMTSIASATVAGLQNTLGAYHNLPVGFDHYRNDIVGAKKDGLLRQAYDQRSTSKGTVQVNETEEHPVRAIPIVLGEHIADDKTGALLSRGLHLQFDANFEEDTKEEMDELMTRASAIAPELFEKFDQVGDEEFVELRVNFEKRVVDRLEAMGHKNNGRRVDLYANLLAAREVVFRDGMEVIDDFVEHLAESLEIVEKYALHRHYFETLLGYVSNDSNDGIEGFARVVDGTELRLASTLAFDAYQQHSSQLRVERKVSRQDVLNHLKNFEDSWFPLWNEPTRYEGHGTKRAWVFELTHPDIPESALELAQYANGEIDATRVEEPSTDGEESQSDDEFEDEVAEDPFEGPAPGQQELT